MKLYELERGSYFTFKDEPEVFRLVKIDGMYSIVTDEDGNVYNFAAFAEIEPVKEK
jgi:hypothetical protein